MLKAKEINNYWFIAIFGAILVLPIHGVTNGELSAKPLQAVSQKVEIIGLTFDAMEPFISCDGNTLYFNNSNHPRANTNIYRAKRINDHQFRYEGEVWGINGAALDGVPSMDCQNQFYFISTRNYAQSFESIFTVDLSKREILVREVKNLSRGKLGDLIFDAEISRDGNTLMAVDGIFNGPPFPRAADIFIAQKVANGFQRAPNSQYIMRNINSRDLEYAPSLSADKKILYFTRVKNRLFRQEITIEMAKRESINSAFETPKVILKSDNIIEAPSISSDGKSLYYHKKIRGKFEIFKLEIP